MAVEPVVSELPVEPPLTLKIRNSDDCSQIQSDILNIVNWCYLNKMRIDIQKWFTMTFGFRGTIFDFKISDKIYNIIYFLKKKKQLYALVFTFSFKPKCYITNFSFSSFSYLLTRMLSKYLPIFSIWFQVRKDENLDTNISIISISLFNLVLKSNVAGRN